MAKRKIAVTMAGGVSLGAYEAGVVTELLHALETRNREHGDELELDVMTGGSAGSLTSALVARIMMYDLPGRRRHLFDAWVDNTDIRGLLGPGPANALFSKALIRSVSARYVTEGDLEVVQRATFAPEELRLTFSLSNMSGVDYALPFFQPLQGERFVSTLFSDQKSFLLKRDAGREQWQSVVEHAIASGNFPVAFAPQALKRVQSDYRGAEKLRLFEDTLAFLDGGIFNNEPLREAIAQARDADGGVIDEERLFLLIDPQIDRSRAAEIDPEETLRRHVLRLVAIVVGESQARDWLRTERVNRELRWRDELVSALADLLAATPVTAAEPLVGELDRQAGEVMRAKRGRFPDRYEGGYVGRSLERVRQKHASQYQRLAGDDARQRIFERLVFLINNVAGLQNKAVVQPVLIGSDPTKTAGDQLAGFGGFFDRDWRAHDFRQGRIQAHEILRDVLGAYEPEAEHASDYEIPAEWRDFPNVTMQDADRGVRRELRGLATDRVMDALRDDVPWLLRGVVKRFVVRRTIGKLLLL